MLGQVNHLQLKAEAIYIMMVNILIATVLFTVAYKKCGAFH